MQPVNLAYVALRKRYLRRCDGTVSRSHCSVRARLTPALIPYNKRLNREKLLSPDDVAQAAYQIVTASPRTCPAEVILQSQFEPFT